MAEWGNRELEVKRLRVVWTVFVRRSGRSSADKRFANVPPPESPIKR